MVAKNDNSNDKIKNNLTLYANINFLYNYNYICRNYKIK